MHRRPLFGLAVLLALASLPTIWSCATNPATGDRQLMLISEEQEIEMGREYDPQVVAMYGIYDDPDLRDYIASIGSSLAAESERPNLPWTFRLMDDPIINAFAVPGGFIYITRGILSMLNSEAELAGVLGHEIGHVTARHTANAMSRQQIQNLGLGVGALISDEFQQYGGLLATGLGVLNLKYGRDDETQSDRLGIRYMTRESYDPYQMVGVFKALELASGDSGSRLPEWQSTHPSPTNRAEDARAVLEGMDTSSLTRVNRDTYLRKLDGLVYGPDPRHGYFRDETFYHPDMAFSMQFPAGWNTTNQRSLVGAVTDAQDALLTLTLSPEGNSPAQALQAFLSQEGIEKGSVSEASIHGLPAARADFGAATGDGSRVAGEIAFIGHRNQVFQLLGYAKASAWSGYATAVGSAIGSFRPVTDAAVLNVEPHRIDIVEVNGSMTFADFLERYPSTAPEEDILRMNRADRGTQLFSGQLVKRVTGGNLP